METTVTPIIYYNILICLFADSDSERYQVAVYERQLREEMGDLPDILEGYAAKLAAQPALRGEEAFGLLQEEFALQTEKLEKLTQQVSAELEDAFDFMEAAFGESQEMVVFITELSVNRYAAAFLEENDCDRYFMYNKRLLFADREAEVRQALDDIRDLQIT